MTTIPNWVCVTVLNFGLYLIYRIELPFFERYKISANPWPWYEDPDGWRTQIKKTIFNVSFNNMFMIPFAMIIDLLVLGDGKVPYSLKTEDLPTTYKLVLSITFFMLMEDFVFHFSHKLLHTPFFYRHIHKIHH